MSRFCLLLAGVATFAAGSIDNAAVEAILQQYADAEHGEWNMSLSVAFYSPTMLPNNPLVAVAAGYTNGGLLLKPADPRKAEADDVYVWGSITKMFTCPAGMVCVFLLLAACAT